MGDSLPQMGIPVNRHSGAFPGALWHITQHTVEHAVGFKAALQCWQRWEQRGGEGTAKGERDAHISAFFPFFLLISVQS